MRTQRFHAIAATAALALMLAGCTGGGGDTNSAGAPNDGNVQNSAPAQSGDQSKADACQVVQDSLAEFSELSSQMDPTNPQAIIDKFTELSSKSSDALNSITNDEVKASASKAATALGDYVEFLQVVISDPSKAADMSGQITSLQEAFTEVGTVCAS